ncbi:MULTISPECIES: exonuclease domain-containing protein [Mesonia]|uniref:ATP-dependent helicase DinG n=1 Tax=Mesonia oceanica TaxID=2687242 RepID=A0AC61YBL5_9FLAO|nr:MULTISPECIES: exonuclease domain-containing protein [Mesonia]MAN29125.1 exonuclease [Mesonia sp.]MAQ41849.1 exonuclease [Mesonia sp.]MBJ98358.1 exonuclease [Flavobacteriaceae bacterium]VVV01794.1 putative ATP-dependent helicase DinG [Mesonia oceanica]
MYAIVDIETTGGKYNEEGVTEIAIYKFDGHKVVDQFTSLVNPERPIQPFVVNLTGINNEMLRNAPKFYEVAKRIVEITTDCTIVAHNAKFDYRIMRLEFRRLGYEFQRQSICTVELSKKLIPNMPSYSLGKLVKNLGIPLTDRHRASGDALATVKLFKLLLQKDSQKEIITHSVRSNPKIHLDTKLIRIIDELPSSTGVYYMHNEEGDVIYIGKSKNIKKRINQHFTSDNHKSKKIQKEVYTVTYENTGNELLALLKENEEIKKNKPKYNRALKKDIFSYALYQSKDKKGYLQFKIGKASPDKENITTFTNSAQAKSTMERIVEEFELCQKHTGLHKTSGSCFNYSIKECYGACVGEESVEDYNQRARQVIDKYSYENKNMLVIDRGRDVDEKSVILIEDGKFCGMGYFNLNYQMNNIDMIKNIITPMKNNRDSQHIIQSYLRKNKPFKIIEF